MSKDEIVRIAESGDLSALVLAVNRAWAQTYYPLAEYVDLVAHIGEGAPDVHLPVIPSSAARRLPGPCAPPA